ncbi:MAG: hypothetical protein WBL27_05995 [Salinimicrobium sp.]
MKKFKIHLGLIAVFALLFTSCSKDEVQSENSSDKATLSFGAIVQDLAAKASTKQSTLDDLPDCSDDVPAYVEIVLMQGETEVVGTSDEPYHVDLVEGELFTEEDPALELVPGDYILDHFAVYNVDGGLIWIAPRMGGALSDWVENPLPMDISLGAGAKKYVDVPVLCFDNRDVNEYGYTFFELDATPVYEYCFYANYCDPSGRHWPARYSVDISIDGEPVYTGVINNVDINNDGDPYADPLCFDLPILAAFGDAAYIHYTVTLLDWEGVYDAAPMSPIEGDLSAADIIANFEGSDIVDYNHLRFGCDGDGGGGEEPMDSDNDGVIDDNDNCPNTPEGVEVYTSGENAGCPIDTDGDGVPDYLDDCDNDAGPESNNGCPTTGGPCDNLDSVCSIPQTNDDLDDYCYFVYPDFSSPDTFVIFNSTGDVQLENNLGENFGNLTLSGTVGSGLTIEVDGNLASDRLYAYEIEIRPQGSTTCWQSFCDADVQPNIVDGDQQPIVLQLDSAIFTSFPLEVRVKAIICAPPL